VVGAEWSVRRRGRASRATGMLGPRLDERVPVIGGRGGLRRRVLRGRSSRPLGRSALIGSLHGRKRRGWISPAESRRGYGRIEMQTMPPPGPVPGPAQPPLPPPEPPPPPPPPVAAKPRSPLGRLVLSLALFGVGIVALIDVAGARVPASVYFAVALAVVAAGLVAGAWYGRARW